MNFKKQNQKTFHIDAFFSFFLIQVIGFFLIFAAEMAKTMLFAAFRVYLNVTIIMKKTIQAGLSMALATISFVGCTSEGAMNVSSQVEYQDVNICFFDSQLEQMGAPSTRTDDVPLGESFDQLDVALVSVKDVKTKYTASQSSGTSKFGTVSMRVPTGEYTLLGIAHKCVITGMTKSATIESAEKVSFANNVVGDVAYVKQAVTVGTLNPATTACSLKRAVALFRINCQDSIPKDAKEIDISFDKNCSFFLNPTTGLSAKTTDGTHLTYTVNKTTDENRANRTFGVYLFLAEETTQTSVTVKTSDGSGKVLNTMTFNDVKLQVNHVTTYTGKFFTAGEGLSFSFSEGDFVSSSDYDLNF